MEVESPKIRGPIARFFQNPWVQTALNFTLANGAYWLNRNIQVFCQPVTWAAITLVFAFIPVVFWPLIKYYLPKLIPIAQFLRGIAFCICLYCIGFYEFEGNLIAFLAVLAGIGIFGLAPQIFIFLMLRDAIIRRFPRKEWIAFSLGIVLSFAVSFYFVYDFHASANILSNKSVLENAYEGPHADGIERIVGMHFKYHTRVLLGIDGWRPPLHDPALIIGLWSVGGEDPIQLRLDERIDLYMKLFPDLNPQADCICAYHDGLSYLSSGYFKWEF